MLLQDQIALVTGAGAGIGQAVALELAKEGCHIVVNDVRGDMAEATAGKIRELARRALVQVADIAQEEQVQAMFEAAVAEFGRVDILVNNAGITRDALILRMSLADWEAVLGVNLRGTFLCTRAAAKIMARQKAGRIISISSVVGLIGNAGQANYAASKAGVVGLTKSVAKELAGRGVTVNALAPGFIETEMTARLPEEAKQEWLARVPLKRAGTPWDVARAVVFLASPDAAYITGQVFNVDGGMVT